MAPTTCQGDMCRALRTTVHVLLFLCVSVTSQVVMDWTGRLGQPGYPNLTTLIDEVDRACARWSSVNVILASNGIQELQSDAFVRRHGDRLYGFTCVTSIDLSNNSLTSLPSGLLGNSSEMWTLKVFIASKNNISSLGRDLFHKGLISLSEIDLSHNALTVFEPWPFLVPSYPKVNLSFNAISEFTNDLGVKLGGPADKAPTIDLRHNRLRYFRIEYFFQYLASARPSVYELIHLQGFNVRDNPWLCDCHLFTLVNTLKQSYYRDIAAYLFTCQDPPNYRGKALDYFYTHSEALVCNLTEADCGCPPGCFCQVRPALNMTLVDCRHSLNVTDLPQVLPPGPLTLDLSGLGLTSFSPGRQLLNVTELILANNKLQTIHPDVFKHAPNLEKLDVAFNRLQKLPVQITALRYSAVNLTGNDLVCSCDWAWVGDWSKFQEGEDRDSDTCSAGGETRMRLQDVSAGGLGCYTTLVITLTLTLGMAMAVGVLALLAAWKWKHKSRVLLYHVTGLHPFDNAAIDAELDGRPYDLYLSADRENMEVVLWVKDYLLPRLEKRRQPYRVYFPVRNEVGGDSIGDQIVENLDRSRRAVFVVTKSSLHAGWWVEEFDHAQWALEQGQGGPILLILYEAVDPQEVVQEPLRNMLLEGRYLSLTDKWWWKKFLYELPKPRKPAMQPTERSQENLGASRASIVVEDNIAYE